MNRIFRPGIDTLLSRHRNWLAGKRVGLVSHLAATDSEGCLSAERLWRDRDVDLVCLMGPEHGFFGRGGAGEICPHVKHPDWSIPVYSLYGDTRKPTPAMMRRVDALVFDLQDLGARCYTYVSTLRLVLEAAAEAGKEVIVADRPVPLPRVIDGPIAREDHMSFVALVRTPVSYGMTPGEAALWLKRDLNLDVRLRVAKMAGYRRDPGRGPSWPPWLPPSPAIVSWESAKCFPVTVFFEALGAVDHGRRSGLPFQTIGARWMSGREVAGFLTALQLPGVRFYAHRYDSRPREPTPRMVDGIRLAVTDADRFRPVLTAVSIIHCLQELYGRRRVWARDESRPDFFDKLFGTSEVREALLAGEDGRTIASRWDRDLARFRKSRGPCLLYKAGAS